MSTKAIRKALERLATLEDGSTPEVLQALLEVERIELMAKRLNDAGYVDTMLEERRFESGNTLRSIAEGAP